MSPVFESIENVPEPVLAVSSLCALARKLVKRIARSVIRTVRAKGMPSRSCIGGIFQRINNHPPLPNNSVGEFSFRGYAIWQLDVFEALGAEKLDCFDRSQQGISQSPDNHSNVV